ncbi:T9SS type A sorting domain-containing protein [Maribellus sediminis]|uniref:T9SS type A sorting domain-containing protein n=1 Tax=Maribellus sediminis TaxID=2696285 RepID=UPI001431CFF4|nr:T9SS type A sorting domain-containing protein [Maribellus sediminis]
MKYLLLTIMVILFISVKIVKGQSIIEIGFFQINGNISMDSKSNLLVLDGGELIDISTPTLPIQTSPKSPWIWSISDTLKGTPSVVLVSEDYAFMGNDWSKSLFIFNISNPTYPSIVSSLSLQEMSTIRSMAKNDSILYLIIDSNRILSIDISDLTNPFILDTCTLEEGWDFDIALDSHYAYITGYNKGLRVIDISNPSNLKSISNIGSDYHSIAINENLAFLGSSGRGIDIYNISDPLNPYFVYAIPGMEGDIIWDLEYYKNYLYAATNGLGLLVFKIENNKGTKVASYKKDGGGQCFSVCIQDSLILLSTLIKGIAVLRLDCTGTTSNSLMLNNDYVNVYPNPANDYIKINNLAPDINKIEIYDLKGSLINRIQNISKNMSIDISNIKAGEYSIRLINQEKIITKNFIKVE